MTVPIKTNQIELVPFPVSVKTDQKERYINDEAVDRKFDIFVITTSDPYIKEGAAILDAPISNKNVCAVRFSSGKSFSLLMYRQDENLSLLRSVFKTVVGGDKITITKQKSKETPPEVLLQLLLNSLAFVDSQFLRYNNLTGHLYCFHPNWLKHSRNIIMKVPCLEIELTNQLLLLLHVRTFSNTKLQKKMVFDRKKFHEYPQYILSEKNTMRRKLPSDSKKDETYILKQTGQKRTELPFLDIKNLDRFSASKLGILNQILKSFNQKYSDIATIKCKEVFPTETLDYTCDTAKENISAVQNALTENPVKLVDCIGDPDSKQFCSQIAALFQKIYHIPVTQGPRLSSKYLNVRVIHNETYYQGKDDPYRAAFPGYAVQHITLEDFSESCEAAIKTIVHELLIKQDLKNHTLSLYDWKALSFQQDWIFGIPTDPNDPKEYLFMTIHPDGAFQISKQNFDLLDQSEYSHSVSATVEAKTQAKKQIKRIICNGDKKINIIRDTDWYSIPEIERIEQELKDRNTYLRGKVKRDALLSSCLDIKYIDGDLCAYYFVGTIGNGMRATIHRACKIRKIEPYGNAPIFFKALLPLMNVSFVRNGQLTVLPFPFKYLKEYLKMQ